MIPLTIPIVVAAVCLLGAFVVSVFRVWLDEKLKEGFDLEGRCGIIVDMNPKLTEGQRKALRILDDEDVRALDGRYNKGFIDKLLLDRLVEIGEVRVKKVKGLEFYTRIKGK